MLETYATTLEGRYVIVSVDPEGSAARSMSTTHGTLERLAEVLTPTQFAARVAARLPDGFEFGDGSTLARLRAQQQHQQR